VLYVRALGDFSYKGMGAGIDLVISDHGPVFAKVKAPVGMPLDPAGQIILTGVTGGMIFGGEELRDVEDPRELVRDPLFFNVLDLTNESLEAALARLLSGGNRFTWEQSFTIGLAGHITTLASPGILTADVHIAANAVFQGANAGLRLLGAGNVSLWGIPLARAGLLFSFSNPLAPSLNFAFAAPAPDNPLGFLFPAKAEFTVRLTTDGLIEAPLIGIGTFVAGLGTATINALATPLENDHSRPLAQVLLDTSGDGQVSDVENSVKIDENGFLLSRIDALLPNSFDDLANFTPEQLRLAARLANAFYTELFTPGRLEELLPTSSDAAKTFFDGIAQAAHDAIVAANDAFDPSLVITGVIQPTIFGFPIGDPDQEVELILNRRGLSFAFAADLKEMSKGQVNLLSGGLGGFLIDLISLGFETRLTVGFTLDLSPLNDLVDSFITGIAPDNPATPGQKFPSIAEAIGDVINPFGHWEVLLKGDATWLGFRVGSVSGIMFPRQDFDAANGCMPDGLFSTRVINLDATGGGFPDDPSPGDNEPDETRAVAVDQDTSKIPVTSTAKYDAMCRYGGILLTGQLFLPPSCSNRSEYWPATAILPSRPPFRPTRSRSTGLCPPCRTPEIRWSTCRGHSRRIRRTFPTSWPS